MKNEIVSKTLVLVSIFLFINVIINPIITGNNFVDDTTPPITTHALDPSTPDGENGWYVSNVNVTLNATDDMSGVKEIKYKVNNGATQTIIGDNGTFILDKDKDNLSIEYWAIDNVGNEESHHTFYIDMDQKKPLVELTYEITEEGDLIFTAEAVDQTSKMNRTEFYLNDILQDTIFGPGPLYIWQFLVGYDYTVSGFISNRTITDEYVKFYAIIVITYSRNIHLYINIKVIAYDNAGNLEIDEIISPNFPQNSPSLEISKWYTFSNNYVGYIGNKYIIAKFNKLPINVTPGNINFQFNKLNNGLLISNLFPRFLDHFPLLHRLLDIWRHSLE